MCGIAGYFNLKGNAVPVEPIEWMLNSIRHRGPDGFGVYHALNCVLGHARLSIIDLEGGWQPMFNEDGRFALTYNGEIYNYIELRKELEETGHRFHTNSDTEVVVHSYEEWGEDCPGKFNGQFAFALFDSTEQRLFLCRDRLGVRPLYYSRSGSIFLFGSEAKALFSSGFIAPELDYEGLNQIYSVWSNISPGTPFRNVLELRPGHSMFVNVGEDHREKRYWQIPIGNVEMRPEKEWEEGILHHLERSVRLRLRADVPVGAYLSGGLDSALTATLTKKWIGSHLKTFSLEFEDGRFDESAYQGEMVRFLHTDHSAVRCGPTDIVSNVEETLWATERPILRLAPTPMLLLSRLVRSEGYKVVITGEGADEFFLGYDIFKEAKVREFCSRNPSSRFRAILFRKLYPYLFKDPRTAKFQAAFFLQHCRETDDPFYGHRIRWDLNRRISDFYSEEARGNIRGNPEEILLANLPPGYRELSAVERTQQVEIETLLSSYLLSSQGDRVAMANSVEGRFIFLDHELIEFASRIPVARKMPGLSEKSLLKKIGDSMLPHKVVHRDKFPYRSPDIDAFLGIPEGRKLLLGTLSREGISENTVFDGRKVEEILHRALSRPEKRLTTTENLILVAVLTTQIFQNMFFRKQPQKVSFQAGDHVRRPHAGRGNVQGSITA